MQRGTAVANRLPTRKAFSACIAEVIGVTDPPERKDPNCMRLAMLSGTKPRCYPD